MLPHQLKPAQKPCHECNGVGRVADGAGSTWCAVCRGSGVEPDVKPVLSLREYYAGLAMQGMLSNPTLRGGLSDAYISKTAVEYADALILELAKPKP